jgi:multidrug efflux pump subunit AcrA (membrane-fusion protein)
MSMDRKLKQRLSMWAISALVGAGGMLAAYHYGPKTAKVDVPVTRARVADFAIGVRAKGEIRSVSSDIIVAPQAPGLRLVQVAETGKAVKGGDVVVEFDNATEDVAGRGKRSSREFDKTIVRAPHDGIVSILPNFRASGTVDSAPPIFKPGDRVWAGAAIAEIADSSKIRLEFKLEEVDRGKVQLKQSVKVRVDAIPDREFPARLDWISPIASIAFKGMGLTEKTFLAHATLQKIDGQKIDGQKVDGQKVDGQKVDGRLKPGMPGSAEIVIESHPGQLLIPVRASFTQDGKPTVYLQMGDEFIPRPIEVGRRNDTDLVVLNGLKEGDKVSLEDPAVTAKRARKLQ